MGSKRQQQVGKNDGRVHAELSAAVMVTSAASSGCLQISTRVWCLRNVAVLLHIAACLAQKPDRRAVDRAAQTGAEETAAVEDGVGDVSTTAGFWLVRSI